MNEPERERSGLSMALSAVLGAGAGAAAGRYGTRYLPAIKKIRDPSYLKEGGAGWNQLANTNRAMNEAVADLSRQRGSKYTPDDITPSADELDGMRKIAELTEAQAAKGFTGLGGVLGAGTGLVFAPKHDVYKEPLR